jgi:hypothetical protein
MISNQVFMGQMLHRDKKVVGVFVLAFFSCAASTHLLIFPNALEVSHESMKLKNY